MQKVKNRHKESTKSCYVYMYIKTNIHTCLFFEVRQWQKITVQRTLICALTHISWTLVINRVYYSKEWPIVMFINAKLNHLDIKVNISIDVRLLFWTFSYVSNTVEAWKGALMASRKGPTFHQSPLYTALYHKYSMSLSWMKNEIISVLLIEYILVGSLKV